MSEQDRSPVFYICEAALKGYKSIEDLRVELRPGLNIIIGKNGAGKSNFLECLYAAISSIYTTKDLLFRSAELVLRSGIGDNLLYTIERHNSRHQPMVSQVGEELYKQKLLINDQLVFDSNDEEHSDFNYKGRLLRNAKNIRGILQRLRLPVIYPHYTRFNIPTDIKGVMTPTTIRIPLIYDEIWEMESEFALLQLAFNNLENEVSESMYQITNVSPEGLQYGWSKLISALTPEQLISNMVLNEAAVDNLRRFTPIENLRLNENITFYNDDSFLIVDNIRLDFQINGNWLPWSQLSDGTKRLFFIIVNITMSRHGTILMEEPELGVHPHQFELVMEFLREQAEDKQIIISTHSPKALDILSKDQLDSILIATYVKGKGTTLHRMAEGQVRKANEYLEEVGYLSDYWLMSDLEE